MMKHKKSIWLLLFLMFFLLTAATGYAEDDVQAQPLSLDECINIVLAKNPAITIAESTLQEKNFLLESAKKDRYPTLSTQYQYLRQFDAGTTGSSSQDNLYSYSVSMAQPVYKGGALKAAVDAGALDVNSADSARVQAKNNLLLDVHKAFYGVLKVGKLEEVADQALIRLQAHLKDANAFYEAGLIPKNDLLESEVQLAQGQQDLLQSRNNTSVARSVLNVLMQRPVDAPLVLKDDLPYGKYTMTWPLLEKKALEARPEIQQAKIAIDRAEQDVLIARAPLLPTVALSASYAKQGDDVFATNYDHGASEVKKATTTASWDFWTWGKHNDKVFAAERRVQKARDTFTTIKDSITQDAHKTFLGLKLSEENIGVTQKAVEQAEENYRINQARYQAQLNTSTQVLDAQSLLAQAKTNYYNALFEFEIAKVTVDWAAGIIGGGK